MNLKRILPIVAICLAVTTVHAAEGKWLTDFDAASKKAKEENKLLLMDFTGSDWCPPCKLLHKNVFSQKTFVDYAKDNLVLMEIDFPQRKPQSAELKAANKKLAEKFSIEAFPTVIVLGPDGKKLSEQAGYGGTKAEAFVANLKSLQAKID